MAIVDMTRESMFDRMKRAAMLDVSVYESVEADRSATGQAAAVVAMVAVAQAIGSAGEGVQGHRFALGCTAGMGGVVGRRQAIDFSTVKAVLTAVIGWRWQSR